MRQWKMKAATPDEVTTVKDRKNAFLEGAMPDFPSFGFWRVTVRPVSGQACFEVIALEGPRSSPL
jgi:hypothetical protein